MSDTTHQANNEFRKSVQIAKLIGRVERDHPEAAQWLRDNLASKSFTQPYMYTFPIVSLAGLFVWDSSPLGHTFWRDLERELRAEGFYGRPE